MSEVLLVLGTRPEIIKFSPVIRELDSTDVQYEIVHTGQHYSRNLNEVFFDRLDIPRPDYNLKVGSGPHGQQTADILAGVEAKLLDESPDTVLVQGDTNSVLAGAIATSKFDSDLGHVEAGLRSFNDIPEETNRVLTDHVSDYLFAPTRQAKQNLEREGIPEEDVFVTGNTIVDAVQQNREIAAEKSTVLADLGVENVEYGLMTAHRADNVDDERRFRELLDGTRRVAETFDIPIVYPIHPRAREQLETFDVDLSGVKLVEPLDYLDFLKAQSHAKIILTDSGGVQEEACVLGVPCVTMRERTERPETVAVGANYLAGVTADGIVEGAKIMIDRSNDWENPLGDGTAAEQICRIVTKSEGVLA